MNILIDLSQIPIMRTGVGVYAENLVREFLAMKTAHVFTLVIQDDDKKLLELSAGKAEILRLDHRYTRKLAFRHLAEQIGLPFKAKRRSVDILHTLHYTLPVYRFGGKFKRVVTIHDMTAFLFSEAHLRVKGAYYRYYVAKSAVLANGLAFDSESTQQDFERLLPNSTSLRRVAPLGIAFKQFAQSALSLEAVREKHALKERYLLCIGTVEPRKNIPRLINAFNLIKRDYPDLILAVVGLWGWKNGELSSLLKDSAVGERVRFLGYVPESEKIALLHGASAFVYPSIYEGFGIPVLEAMACGTPVITSNRSSMPEVAGDSALLVDPMREDSIAAAIRILLDDPVKRAECRAKGIERAKGFTWQRCAQQTLGLYEEVFAEVS